MKVTSQMIKCLKDLKKRHKGLSISLVMRNFKLTFDGAKRLLDQVK